MNAQPLFPPTDLPEQCPVCHATRQPGHEKAPACTHDRDQESGTTSRRPRGCINTYDPKTTPIPY